MLNFKQVIKKLFFLGLLVFFIGGCATKTTYPQWFSQRTVDNKNKDLIIGFGEGKSKEEAEQNALNNISKQIELKIIVEINSTKDVNRSNEKEDYKSFFSKEIRMSSSSDLFGAKLLRQEFISGVYYASFGFDNRSLKSKLKGLKCQLNKLNNNFKSSLPINKTTNCSWFLDYRQKNWYLDTQNKNFRVRNVDLINYFFIASKNKLKIGIYPKAQLKDGDYYHIKLTSKESGFLSLYLINQLGQIQTLVLNEQFNGSFVYPDLKKYNGVTAKKDIKEKNTIARDMLLAFVCKENNDLVDFTPMGENELSNSNTTFTYGRLLELGKNCEWGSAFIYVE
jgi:hypothetical protein